MRSIIYSSIHNFVTGVLYSILCLGILFLTKNTYALTVSSIGTDPAQPVYGQEFHCLIGVDSAEPNLACGMTPVNAPSDTKPWDICPKLPGTSLGRQAVGPPTATYGCIAQSSTHVPGPGTYRIVAWYFSQDGAVGQVMNQATITILSTPPPTVIPTPTIPEPTIAVPTVIPVTVPPTLPNQHTITAPSFEIGSKQQDNQNITVSPTPTQYSYSVSGNSIGVLSSLSEMIARPFLQTERVQIQSIVDFIQSVFRNFTQESGF